MNINEHIYISTALLLRHSLCEIMPATHAYLTLTVKVQVSKRVLVCVCVCGHINVCMLWHTTRRPRWRRVVPVLVAILQNIFHFLFLSLLVFAIIFCFYVLVPPAAQPMNFNFAIGRLNAKLAKSPYIYVCMYKKKTCKPLYK